MHFTFTPVSQTTFPVIVELFDDSRDDWVDSPDTQWLQRILESDSVQADIIYHEDSPIGYLQYAESGQEIDSLAIFIAIEFRGQGYGPQILQQFIASKSDYRSFKAYIDESDFLGTSAFENAGFIKTGVATEEGAHTFEYQPED